MRTAPHRRFGPTTGITWIPRLVDLTNKLIVPRISQTWRLRITPALSTSASPHAGGNPQDRGEYFLEFQGFRISRRADLGGRSVGPSPSRGGTPVLSTYAYEPKQAMNSLRKIEVGIAKGNTTHRAAKSAGKMCA